MPVIVNSSVEYLKENVNEVSAWFVLKAKSLDEVVETIPDLLQLDSLKIREAIVQIYGLTNGILSYLACYKSLIS